MTPKFYIAGLSVLAILGAVLRVWLGWDADVWYDEIARVWMAELSWEAVAVDLTYLGNLKSPFLVAFHKPLQGLFGTASIPALRAPGIVFGVAHLVLLAWIVRKVAGDRAALAAAAICAIHPLFLRWSIEIHNYTPAGLAVLVAYGLAAKDGPLSLRRAAAIGAACGLAIGTFPPVAVALVGLPLLPSVTRSGWRAPAVAVATGIVVAAPALMAIAVSRDVFASVYDEGRAFNPYFNPRWTPFQMLARLAGLDARQGVRAPEMRWLAIAGGGALLLHLALQGRALAQEASRRRLAILVGGGAPLVLLSIASLGEIRLVTDRYVHACTLLFPALVPLLVPSIRWAQAAPRARAIAIAGGVAAFIALLPLIQGLRTVAAAPERFPRDLRVRSQHLTSLLRETLAGTEPDAVLAYSETSYMAIRYRAPEYRDRLRHLTTDEWIAHLEAGDHDDVGVPQAYGWPFTIALLDGASAITSPSRTKELWETGSTVVLATEARIHTRRMLNEDAEVAVGWADAIRDLATGRAAAEPDRFEAHVRRLLHVPDDYSVSLSFEQRAVVAVLAPR